MLLHDRPFQPPGLGRSRRAITATSPVTTADQGIIIDATSGTYDVTTATAASTFGSGFSFGLYNSGTGAVSFNPNGAETVRTPAGTATTVALTQGMGVFVVCDGTNWDVVCSIGLAAAPTTPLTVRDNAFTVTDETDTTKTFVFSLGSQSAGVDVIFNTGAQTLDVSATLPVLAASDTFAMLGVSNLFSKKNSFGDGAAVTSDASTQFAANSGQTGATQSTVIVVASSIGACTTQRGLNFVSTTDNSTQTITSLVGIYSAVNTKGANDTVTRSCAFHARRQTVGATANFGFAYGSASSLPAVSGTYCFYNSLADDEFHNGINSFNLTTDATALGTAGVVNLGGISNAKTLITAKGQGWGVTSTVTHNGATTLVQGSTIIQTFTGTTAGEIPTMPAVNLWGAGIAYMCCINNQSNQTITPTRAGSDTFQGGGTTDPVLAGATQWYAGNGVATWLKI